MSIHLSIFGSVSTYPCFILHYIASKSDRAVYHLNQFIHLSDVHLGRFENYHVRFAVTDTLAHEPI